MSIQVLSVLSHWLFYIFLLTAVWGVCEWGLDRGGGQPDSRWQRWSSHGGMESYLLDNKWRSHAELWDPNQPRQQWGNAVGCQGKVQVTSYNALDYIITFPLPYQSFSPFSLWTMRPRRSAHYSSKWRMRILWLLMSAMAPVPQPLSMSQCWTSTRALSSSPIPWQSPKWKTSLWAALWPPSTPQIQIYYRYRASGKSRSETNWNWAAGFFFFFFACFVYEKMRWEKAWELVCVVWLNVICCSSLLRIVSNELSDFHSVSLCSAEECYQELLANGSVRAGFFKAFFHVKAVLFCHWGFQ